METQDFINVRRLIASKNPKLLKWLPGFLIRYVERILHQDEINTFIRNNPEKRDADFCKAVIDYIGISYTVSGLENIPEKGKCVLVMNHPLGGMDAMILVDALRSKRTDMKFIVNDLLLQLEPLHNIFVGVNKHGKTSNESMTRINDLFASEQCVCIFPAGLVSRKQKGIIRDLVWKKTFVRLSKLNDQTIVPIHIEGKLSKFFYRLSNFRRFLGIKLNIEMLYLADELFRQKGQTINFSVGKPIAAADLDSSKSDAEWSEWFRQHIYTLK